MTRLGYVLSCEEHGPNDLVRYARRAEDAGFDFVLISDHYHPWTSRQGNSAFVWTVIGAIARETDRIRIGTGVTCPTVRIHPAIVAQAAATSAVMLPQIVDHLAERHAGPEGARARVNGLLGGRLGAPAEGLLVE